MMTMAKWAPIRA